MTVKAIRPGYHGDMKDTVDKFHGNQLLNIGWDKHLMFATPVCIPVPPHMPFGALLQQVLPSIYGQHPDFAKIDWNAATWTLGGAPFTPDASKSLADNGLTHKASIRLRTPGLDGLAGVGF